MEEAGSDLEPLRALAERLPDSVSPGWLVAAGIITLLGIMTLFSIVMALVRYHGYRLEKAGIATASIPDSSQGVNRVCGSTGSSMSGLPRASWRAFSDVIT